MTHETFSFDFSMLGLTAAQVQHDIGYRQDDPDASVIDLISEVLTECKTLNSIRAEYRIFNDIEFDPLSKSVRIGNIFFEINKIVYNQLTKSESIAVFLSTAGGETATRSKEAMADGDLLKGFIYDVIGSEIVEAAAELMNNELNGKMMQAGLKTTNRLNPGYCGWNVTEQHKLFALMPDNYCGISLTESALMNPVKSSSGFIGIGNKVKRVQYTCSFCDRIDCFYRRVGV